MTDEEVILEAWGRRPSWDWDSRPRMNMAPQQGLKPVWRDKNQIFDEPFDLITFRRETGSVDGKPAARVVGAYRKTEMQVELGFLI